MKNTFPGFAKLYEQENHALSLFYITGEGRLVIMNTGGTGASEGGMGSGSNTSKEKGTVDNPGAANDTEKSEADEKRDPVKKDIDKAEERNKTDE